MNKPKNTEYTRVILNPRRACKLLKRGEDIRKVSCHTWHWHIRPSEMRSPK